MYKKLFWYRLISSFLSFTIIVLSSSCSGSKTASSTFISSIEGDAQIKKAGSMDWVKAEVKVILSASDIVKTDTNSKLSIIFFDGSTIELKQSTQIEILELIEGKAKIIRLKQEIGDTISKIEKLTDPAARYEIETPAAVAGVRGSSMLVSVTADGTTTVQNLEGQISVTANSVEIKIPEGGTGTVKPGESPILELSYDDGNPEGGYSLGSSQDFGFLVRFSPSATPFKITRIKIFSWIKGTPKESNQFTLRITDKTMVSLWEVSLSFTLFTTEHRWLELDVPDLIVNDKFYVQLYAPSLGQGLGPYIGMDRSGVNQHSELLSGWQITPWTLSIPKEQTNWMIRVNGNISTTTEP